MRAIRVLALLALTACGIRNPVRNTVVIEPANDGRHVTVTARTDIGDSGSDAQERERIRETGAALLEHRDPWAPRFAGVSAAAERVAYDKSGGALRHFEHSVTIAIDDLQRLMGEIGTVQSTGSERWSELAFYPASSVRATHRQRDDVEAAMHTWSHDAVSYFHELDALYRYLDRQPQRARAVFTILFSDKDDEHSTIEEEDALITAVNNAMTATIDHVDAAKRDGVTLDEEFDLVFNPLPGEIVVRVPGPILESDGFERRDERTVAIPRSGLVDAVLSLEGRWATPDPLAILGHADETNATAPKPEEIAAQPRRSNGSVTAEEIERALAARLRPTSAYRVRWGN